MHTLSIYYKIIFVLLLQAGASPNTIKFHFSIYFLKVDAAGRELQTPLHIASRLGNTDIIVLLLQASASPNAATRDLYTPLHIAAKVSLIEN